MEDFINNLKSPNFWLSVILVSYIVNVISNLTARHNKKTLSWISRKLSTFFRNRSNWLSSKLISLNKWLEKDLEKTFYKREKDYFLMAHDIHYFLSRIIQKAVGTSLYFAFSFGLAIFLLLYSLDKNYVLPYFDALIWKLIFGGLSFFIFFMGCTEAVGVFETVYNVKKRRVGVQSRLITRFEKEAPAIILEIKRKRGLIREMADKENIETGENIEDPQKVLDTPKDSD